MKHVAFVMLLSWAANLLCAQSAPASGLSEEQHLQMEALIGESAVFGRGFSGFALFDPAARAYLYSSQPDHSFTPASNTKILTLFTSISLLGEGMPLVFYQSNGDTLWCWGTGNPLLLHPAFEEVDSLKRWLLGRPESVIVVSDHHWRTPRFGEGWCWDDYPSSYQCDRSPMPIYGNVARWHKAQRLDQLQCAPPYFEEALVYRPELDENTPLIDRAETHNIFYFGRQALRREQLSEEVPFHYSLEMLANMLSDTLHRQVVAGQQPLPPKGQYQVLSQAVPDTLYRKMMQESDNFLAEQLLILCAARRYGRLSIGQLLDYARDTLLGALPRATSWADGSGLSRYNQLSPRSLVQVLDQLHSLLTEDYLFQVFAAGGRSGTIKTWYAGPEGQPFVYAKTGTLRRVHCLSGYVRTRSNRTLIFSFMHNNFPGPIHELRSEMDKALRWIHDAL